MNIVYGIHYWWGTYTKELEAEGWNYNNESPPFKILLQKHSKSKNGEWKVIRFYHDGAWYSWCDRCGYVHAVSKDWTNDMDNANRYDRRREFNYCPQCGKRMIKTKKTRRRGY